MPLQFYTNGPDLWVLNDGRAKFWPRAEWVPARGSMRMAIELLRHPGFEVLPLEMAPPVLAKLQAPMPPRAQWLDDR